MNAPPRSRPARLSSLLALCAALGTLATAAPTIAQEADSVAWATLTGQVVSAATGEPMAGARVSLRGSGYGAVTDSAGHFRIPRATPGADTVEVGYLGYEESALPLHLEPDRITRVVLLLSPRVIRLAELVVEVRRDPPSRLSAFERRRKLGLGHYITFEEIQKRDPRHPSDLLRTVPGVRVGVTRFGRAEVAMTRTGRPCPPSIVLDGVHIRDLHIDELSAQDLEAMEIYTGPSQVPGEYSGLPRGCGTIVVWTRRGGVRP